MFISLEDLNEMWNNPKEALEKEPKLQMSFLVMSCMHLTTVGSVRNGAKAMSQILDRMLPDQAQQDEPPTEADLN